MKRLRTRFGIRSLMIAVALVGLNLAGAIAVAKHHPSWTNRGRGSSPHPQVISRTWHSIVSKEGRGLQQSKSSFIFLRLNGTIEIGRGIYGSPREQIKRIVLAPTAPTTLQIWSPLIASVSVTILMVVAPRKRPGSQRGGIHSNGDSLSPRWLRRLWLVVRWLMIVMALVGLNLVATLYRPAPAPFDDLLESPIRSTADLLVKPNGGIEIQPHGNPLVMKPDGGAGRLVIKADGSADSQSPTGGHGPPAGYGDDPGRTLGTVVYKPDGSIVGHTGKPGEMRSRPHLIRAPMRVIPRNAVAGHCQCLDYGYGPRFLACERGGVGSIR